MACASPEPKCGPCDYRNIEIPAIVWCPDCQEGLCVECLDHHDAARASRNHKPISIDSFKDLPDDVFNIKLECDQHNEKYELYCPTHEVQCCVECVTVSHESCKGITLLGKVLENVKSSAVLQSLERALEDRISNLEKVEDDRKGNILRLDEQALELNEIVTKLRLAMEQRIVYLTDKAASHIKSEKSAQESIINNAIKKLESHKSSYSKMRSVLEQVKQSGSNFQIFTIIKRFENQLTIEDNNVESLLQHSNSFREHSLKFTQNSKLTNILSEDFNFGNIEVVRFSPKCNLDITKENCTAQISSKTSNENQVPNLKLETLLNNSQIVEKKYGYCKGVNISGVVFLKTGEVLLADGYFNGGGIIKFDKSGKFLSWETKFGTPQGACLVEYPIVAFSFPRNKNIKVLQIENMELRSTITCYDCTSISSTDGKIVACIRPHNVNIYDVNGRILRQISGRTTIPSLTNVFCFQSEMILTDSSSDIVWCFDKMGKKLWKFGCKGEDFRNCCVDKYGNIFVSELKNCKVILINPKNGESKDLLSSADGLVKPKAIAYEENSNSIVVVGEDGIFSAMYRIVYE